MPKITLEENKKYPTVGEMLDYIHKNAIPMDAIVTCEQLEDYYLKDDGNHKSFEYYTSQDEFGEVKLIPAHNGFGSSHNKKFFVLWMHF